MTVKEIKFAFEARDGMLRGIDTLANAVRVTLGPKGRHVAIEKSFGAPRITKDGVTVANEIELGNNLENIGAQMVREVASKTSYLAGDGTTTAVVLAHAIVKEGVKAVAAGMNPMDLKRGIDLAVEFVVAEIRKSARKVTSNDEIAQIGAISANGDLEIGRLLADAMKKVGNDGLITVEDGTTLTTELEIVAYGPGISMLKIDSPVAVRIAEAVKSGVKVVACQNTMKAQKLIAADMLPTVDYVPAGVVELMKKQQEGYAYIRP